MPWVLTTPENVENMEISGNLLILENLREFEIYSGNFCISDAIYS